MTDVAKPAPARANTIDPKTHALFRYGPTKCAVILKDMVDAYDAYTGGRQASKSVGRALAKVDEMLDLVTRHYVERHAAKRKNLLNINDNSGFKEHLVWLRADSAALHELGQAHFPSAMYEMFLTVAKEKISSRKAELGINAPKSGIDYKTADLIEWNESEIVRHARNRFRAFLSTNDRNKQRTPIY